MKRSTEELIGIGLMVVGGVMIIKSGVSLVNSFVRDRRKSKEISENLNEIDEVLKKEGYIRVGRSEWVHSDQIH